MRKLRLPGFVLLVTLSLSVGLLIPSPIASLQDSDMEICFSDGGADEFGGFNRATPIGTAVPGTIRCEGAPTNC